MKLEDAQKQDFAIGAVVKHRVDGKILVVLSKAGSVGDRGGIFYKCRYADSSGFYRTDEFRSYELEGREPIESE